MLKTRQPVPGLELPLVGGGTYSLASEKPSAFNMVVIYRGLHCPICKTHLRDLDAKLSAFTDAGVAAIAVSSDVKDRAEKAKAEWGIANLRVAYGMPIDLGRKWGLYVSHGISDAEPKEFLEPGLFLVRPDNTLYAASVQTMPFARPSFADVLGAIQFVTKKDYPARGEA